MATDCAWPGPAALHTRNARPNPAGAEAGRSATRLVAVELFGFKSFAERTVFEFGEGVTALVGPNGSGKSNVIDALRWAFGEQNPRLLRGSRWEEVIFAGGPSRAPLGMAEVTARLDNQDGSLNTPHREVELTRRLVRGCESEYRINRVPCRLKDVLDLLSGTGASGEAYAYVAQAAVDEILNSRPEDRRRVIEEAAGLARYRGRRHETEQRLAELDTAGQRLSDLAAELAQQLEPLRREAEAAERFGGLRRRQEELEALLWADALGRVDRRHSAATRRAGQLRGRIAELTTALGGLEAELESTRGGMLKLERLRAETEHAARTSGEEEHRRRAVAAMLGERLANLASEIVALKERQALLLSRRREFEGAEKVAVAVEPCGEDTARRQALEEARRKADLCSASRAQAAARERDLRRRLAETRRERQALGERAAATGGRLEASGARLGRLDADVAAMDARIKDLEAGVGGARESSAQAQEALRALATVKQGVEVQLLAMRESEAAARESRARAESRLQSLQERCQELAADLGGRTAAGTDGERRALADSIVVTPGLEPAVEAALGMGLRALLVEDWQAGVRALRASSGQGGPAALPEAVLPLGVPGTRIPPRAACPDLLCDHVRPGARTALTQQVLDRLLGHVALIADLASARDLFSEHPGLALAVTRDGMTVLPSGMMVRGSASPVAGTILRRLEREGLPRRLSEQRTELESAVARHLGAATRRRQLEEELKALGQRIGSAEEAAREAATRLGGPVGGLEEATARLDSLGAQRERDRLELRELEDAAERERARCAAKDLEVGELEVRLKEAVHQFEQQEALAGAAVEDAGRLAAEAERAGERLRSLRSELGRARQESERASADCVALEGRLESLEPQAAAARLQASAEETALLGCSKSRAETEARTRELGRELRALGESAAARERQVQELRAARAVAERRLHNLELWIERLAGESRSIQAERRSLAPRLADLGPALRRDREELRAALGEVTTALEQTGQVNLGAAEQCRRLGERQEYLLRQGQDLRASQAALAESLADLEREMERRFAQRFEDSRTRFGEVFGGLFGGGSADLRFAGGEGGPGSGVEIVAQPPGKRPTSLALLSGGERALTAIAFLLSLVFGGGPGFCVLDEVDAYLDEPNCGRFGAYIRQAAAGRQFLVVTHNKTTLEAADVLYGLTMEEAGVSRVVSVRLEDRAAGGALGPAGGGGGGASGGGAAAASGHGDAGGRRA